MGVVVSAFLVLVLLIGTAVVGWLGWSLLWAVPLGYATFTATFWGRREEASKHFKWVWLSAPLMMLPIMLLGRGAHRLIDALT